MSEPVSSLPGTNRFGPFRAGQILERTADLIRESPMVFFGIGLLAVAAAAIAGMIFLFAEFLLRHVSPDGSPAARTLALAPLALLCFGAAFVVAQIAQGAFFVAARQRLQGARPSVGEACGVAAERLGTLAGIAILIALRIIGYLLVFYLACAIVFGILIAALGGMRVLASFSPGHMASSGAILLLLLLGLTFFVLYLLFLAWLIARYSLSVPAAMEEGVSAGEAIRRSIALTHGAKGRVIALLVFAFGVNLALAIVTLPVQILLTRGTVAPYHGISTAGIAVILAITLLRLFVGWVVSVFLGVGFVLCYFDLRVRKENFGGSTTALPPASLAVVGGAVTSPQAPVIQPLPIEPQGTDLPQDDLPIS